MLKILNSTVGQDAVGADEAKRLASFLQYKIANFTGPGSFMGRDLEKFYTQVAEKNNAIKGAVAQDRQQIAKILEGNGIPDLQMTDTKMIPPGSAQAGNDQSGYKPGSILEISGKRYRVEADGDTLTEMP